MKVNIHKICQELELDFISVSAVSGGNINDAFLVTTRSGRFFLKVNDKATFPAMFEAEAEGLTALRQQNILKVPEVVAVGELEDHQYLVLEWLEKALIPKNFWEDFAKGLAALHIVTNSSFGWHCSNYIGSLVQQNNFTLSREEFYTGQRIMPLVETLFNRSDFVKTDVTLAEKVCRRLNEIFPQEPPSLLHGDLWSGNFMAAIDEDNSRTVPVIFDPAVYFGHREMDLGMTILFGGFNDQFYEAYHSFYPLEPGWKKRVALTQLYPLLVHAVLFGGSYINRCKTTLREWGA